MFVYTFNKIVNSDKLMLELAVLSGFKHLNITLYDVKCYFEQELTASEVSNLESLINAHNPADAKAQVQRVIADAVRFGDALIEEFAAENVLMGITAEGKTGQVRKAMAEPVLALKTGSLLDAIDEARAIPESAKDGKYITNARLLIFINKIEAYLGRPLSTEL